MGAKKDNNLYIGKRSTHSYVLAAMMVLNEHDTCVIKARGRAISHAVDVAEVLRNRFMKNLKVADIQIGTEVLTGRNGKETNVPFIEITVGKDS
ncbi:DNA-binding protein Alba [Candidatus Bathyarchaeota archaeon]|nr:DNA-binding protein Alba [Candidatus Bathyarchaeota archaeon]